MNDVANAILDAADRRMRRGGFNGFSFREIAQDVGVKSSSVHYHFPTKEALAAAVIGRYVDRLVAYVEAQAGRDPLEVWLRAFRHTLTSAGAPCVCPVLAAAALDLPPVVAAEVRRFFTTSLGLLAGHGFAPDEAELILSTCMGAMVMAGALGDAGHFDRATAALRARL